MNHAFQRRIVDASLACALALATPLAWSQAPAAPPAAAADTPEARQLAQRRAALERAHAATVGVTAVAVEDARSAETLGRTRQGSGVLIGDDGLVLTIGYLILEAERVDLETKDGRKVPARVVAYDLASGFGLLQALTPLRTAAAPLGASGAVSSDEPLVVMSGGDDSALSLARMVSRREFAGYWEYLIDGALFTAPARTDHSGAGLFTADGELIGIGSLIVGDASGQGAGLRGNMFVPIDLLKPIFSELRSAGASRSSFRAWIGINSVEYGGQVRVLRVTPASPAARAGLLPGDAIVTIDGTPVSDLAGFYKALWNNPESEREVSLEVKRGAETVRIGVRSIDRMKTLSRPVGV